ncbi:hypothetical protein [Desulfatiglans anilini]|uniref:hypothetical protein n=1 Tax=Desulfatiglans anilini TaxID=90728 RepID=UPI0004810AB3|nr:hypothetical protein [Desulfatiglans anilini]
MKAQRTKKASSWQQLPGYIRAFLTDNGAHVEGNEWERMFASQLRDGMKGPRGEDPRELWREHGAPFLKQFIEEHPGRRPQAWWLYDAPEPGRRRLGGVGTPCSEVLAYAPYFKYGLPNEGYISEFDLEMYGDDFEGRPIDPSDPPKYESQASYLDRLNLFVPGERERIPPADFEPERIEADEDD